MQEGSACLPLAHHS